MDEKKIRMMAKITDFEQRNHKWLQDAENYYRGDFLGIRLLKNFFRFTFAYAIGLVLWACWQIDVVMKKLNTMDIQEMAGNVAFSFLLFLGVFLAVSYVIDAVRFYRAERKLLTYQKMLAHLSGEYGKEEPQRQKKSRRKRKSGKRQGGEEDENMVEL